MNALVYIIGIGGLSLVLMIMGFAVSYRKAKSEYAGKVKIDISVDEMIDAEKNLQEFYIKNNLPSNASVQEIAQALNIMAGGEDDDITDLARIGEPDENGVMSVTFKKGITAEERRFLFTHELAHLINGDPIPATHPEGNNKPQIEQIADYTAAAILMPLEQVYEYLIKENYKQQSTRKRVAIVNKLCIRYGVSDVIVLRRIQEVQKLKG